MIMEIQFILLSVLKSKKYSHKLYNITRMKDIVDFTNSFIQYQPSLETILLNCTKRSFEFKYFGRKNLYLICVFFNFYSSARYKFNHRLNFECKIKQIIKQELS